MGVGFSKIKFNKSPIVDYGSVVPLGLYKHLNEESNYDLKLIRQLIISRKLSPFYRGISDPNEIIYNKLQFQKRRNSLLYNDSIECPICFLYYPANINFTRCCDQPICTECFVQIKKGSADNCSSIACPYCMTDKFGIIYHCPSSPKTLLEKKHQMRSTTSGLSINPYSKRKIIPSNHPAVVLLDQTLNTFDFMGF